MEPINKQTISLSLSANFLISQLGKYCNVVPNLEKFSSYSSKVYFSSAPEVKY